MMYDEYGEVINSQETYKNIAIDLCDRKFVIIGWTDGEYDHQDILFTYKVKKYGNLQRGMRWSDLYVSIIDHTSYGFLIESDTDNRKHNEYIKEKLRLHDNSCDDKICDLINRVIQELNILENENN